MVKVAPPSADDSTLAVRQGEHARHVAIPWRLSSRLWSYVSAARLVLEQRLFPFSADVARRKFRFYAQRAELRPVHTLDSLRTYAAAPARRFVAEIPAPSGADSAAA
jgi:hypothetical protein